MDILRGGWAPGLLGNGAGLRADSPSTGGYDSASEAIFAAFTTPPTTARKGLIDAAVVALKAAGVWTKLDCLYGFAAADSQAAKINWISPGTFNCTEVNAPGFAADLGFTGAATKYLDTGLNPTTGTPKYTQNSACGFGWSLTSASTIGGMIGTNAVAASPGDMTIYPNLSGTSYYLINCGTNATVAVADGLGLSAVNRSAVGATQLYRNGASIATTALASDGLLNSTRTFFKRGGDAIWAGQCAAGGFGQSLNSTEQTALYSTLNTYLVGVGAVTPVYQAETNAIAAAFTTPPTISRKNAIDTAVVALKTAGVWTKLDALYCFAAADSQAALINWVAPGTYNGTLVNAPVFTADNGFTGASTKYIDTGFNPTTAVTPKFTQNDASVFAWSLSDISANATIVSQGIATSTLILTKLTDRTYGYVNDGGAYDVANTNGTGFFCATRRSATGRELWRNTTSLKSSTLASTSLLNANIWFLAHTAAWPGTVAAGGFGSQFSSADNTALYNALRTYLTAVGVP